MEDGASAGGGEMVTGGQGQGAPGRRGGGAKRGRRERESGGAMVALGQQQGGGSASASASASASRICRVRANGGKDRHSKVVTVKGVRDRRVRLAVPTAIQFYDLQDRLGFDQPSKAVDWLLDAASHAIRKLPPLDPAALSFPADAQQTTKGKQQQQLLQQGSSSTTSGSDLSLSRSDAARGDKQHKGAVTVAAAAGSAQAASSFTELLNGNAIAAAAAEHIQSWHRQQQQQLSAADCVGFAAHPGNNDDSRGAAQEAAYAGLRFGNAPPLGMAPARPLVPLRPVEFTTTTNSAGAIAPFSFVQDVLAAASAPAPATAGDYSLDFSMSSGFMGGGGNSRGTLQSNSKSQYFSNQLQLQLHELDGPSPPFLYDPAAALAAHPSSENRHLTGTPPLQLWNGFRMEEKSQN